MNIDFKNKVILVTGSTSGIGRQIAKQLLENNAKVIINYGHNENMAKETIEELSKSLHNKKYSITASIPITGRYKLVIIFLSSSCKIVLLITT